MCYGAVENWINSINIEVINEITGEVILEEFNPRTFEFNNKIFWFLYLESDLRYIHVDIEYIENNKTALVKIYTKTIMN